MKRLTWVLGGILVLILCGVGTWIWVVKFEREIPTIKLSPDSGYVGQNITVKVTDQKSGVAEVRVEAVQKGKSVILLTEQFPKGTPMMEKKLSMRPLPQGLTDGETQLKIFARDHSWYRGNPVTLEKSIVIDTRPPQLTILGALHYLNRGGTGFLTYQASEEIPVTGVQAGDLFFRGYPAGKNHYLAYFTLGYDLPKEVSTQAVGEDRAGNRTKTNFRLILKSKAFKKDKIQITEGFLKNVIPYFTERDPSFRGTPLEVFLTINRKQRETDHLEIKKICQQTENRPLWSGPFLRLPNSKPMASFAEVRTYLHDGKEIDRQVHLGVDLASLAQSPIPAANSGRVAFAGPLGIYGNTIILDHGCGLFSMYSHLSSLKTEVKKEVKKGETLGHTGTTGLAGGDHLHFSMLVHGFFVNPIEWWDEHWIKDNIEKKMKF
jgi:murein DD-endopeptidase MepM/ murein hydrolase activator NlpD